MLLIILTQLKADRADDRFAFGKIPSKLAGILTAFPRHVMMGE
jgi:hypothetical protein